MKRLILIREFLRRVLSAAEGHPPVMAGFPMKRRHMVPSSSSLYLVSTWARGRLSSCVLPFPLFAPLGQNEFNAAVLYSKDNCSSI